MGTNGDGGITIDAGARSLGATLAVPEGAAGLVVFAHGSGSSRFSLRNRFVAKVLNDARFATLLLDLLTEKEHARDAMTAEHRFDIPLLTERVVGAVKWVSNEKALHAFPMGLFGASTGAAAALAAAAELGTKVKAIVSRGGRPDLAGDELSFVRAPTLLIVGARDSEVIGLNETAAVRLRCEHRLVVVPGATHLFEEPGTLEDVARLAADWFRRWLVARRSLAETGAPKLRRIT